MSQHPSPREGGFSFVEVAFGLLVLVVAAVALVNHLVINYQTTLSERDRVFAYSKAQAILSAIQSRVDRAGPENPIDLDQYDDGTVSRPELSIGTDALGTLVAPDHALSGNVLSGGRWLWTRRIAVQPLMGLDNRSVRYVTVRIFKRNLHDREVPVADLSSVINAAATAYPTTQVLDTYVLAVENIPGWWVYMDSLRPFLESVITDLETRNPGLEIRTHWISKASFGRNPVYRPYVNEANDSLQPIRDVYHYAGTMPAGQASAAYYAPGSFRARMSVDGVERNGFDQVENPYPYALADFYNHAMRLPDERRLWQARVEVIKAREQEIADAIAAGTPPPDPLPDMSKEPTLRLLLEDLYSAPERYRNALLINLHGELLPMPALRNYSDPARDPENHPEVRVVTHPEELRTLRVPGGGSDPVKLRVYAFNTHTQRYRLQYPTAEVLTSPIAVEVMGVNLTRAGTTGPELSPLVTLRCLRGGVLVGSTRDYFPFAAAKRRGDPTLLPGQMCYEATYVDPGPDQEKFTRILLYNTPVVAPFDQDDSSPAFRGLAPNKRSQLYWMPYVPGPVEAARDFSRDLYTPGDGPKNTARWSIAISGNALGAGVFVEPDGDVYNPTDDVVLQVRTRIWSGANPETNGTMWPPAARNQPENLSTTYTWWADSPEDVPITERSQFQGDPRHNPYKDLLNNTAEDFPNGYNWYFDSLENNSEMAYADFPGLDRNRLENRWRGVLQCDVPRFMELLRRGLVRSRCAYTTVTGFSYFYLGLGGEIGYDADNGYPNSIPIDLTPYGLPGTPGYIDTVTGSRRYVRDAQSTNYWWGMPWLGELCPDTAYTSQWLAPDASGSPRGNLAAGVSSGQFRQTILSLAYSASDRLAFGTAIGNANQNPGTEGCTTFFDIGSSSSTFHHTFSTGTGALTTIGQEISRSYALAMPPSTPVSRPFSLSTSNTGTVGEEWNFLPYSDRYSASLLQTYYTGSGNYTGSGLVKLIDPTGRQATYVIVNGLDRTIASGTSFIARWTVLSLVHSFLSAGDAANPHQIPQLPRVEIETPTPTTELNNPSAIDVRWDVAWTRWDGEPYASTVSYVGQESELDYVLMYSRDGGRRWHHVQDDTPARPGERPDATYLLPDAGAGSEEFSWPVPMLGFPEAGYLLRVDCFRRGQPLHYSYHLTYLYIRR